MTTRQLRSASRADSAPLHVAGVAAIALAAALWAVIGSASILPELSANSDEGLYLLQAESLVAGHLAPEAPADDGDAYRPWFSVVRDGRYVLKYAPVHAAVLAASVASTSSPRGALGVIAAAQALLVIALAREMGANRRAALLAGVLFAAAPLVLQLDITFLSYGTSTALLLAAATAALRAQRMGRRAPAVTAGLCWGLAAFARPYDAMLFGLALVVALVLLERRTGREPHQVADRGWRLGRFALRASLGAVVPLIALLAFNRTMTGDAFNLPFHLLEPRDAPGLGLRRALPSDGFLDYTFARALASFGRNLLLLTVWSSGGVVGCGLAIAALVRRRIEGAPLVLALLVIWPVGYALFWGSYVAAYLWDGALFLGPFYYLPLVALLAVPAGVSLDDLWCWRPPVAALASAGALALVVALAGPRLAEQHDRSEQRAVVADTLAAALADTVGGPRDSPALVFVPPLYGPFLQNPLSFLRNDPRLDGPVLYALDRGDEANDRVRAAHPTRVAFRLVLTGGWSDQPGFRPVVEVQPMGGPGTP